MRPAHLLVLILAAAFPAPALAESDETDLLSFEAQEFAELIGKPLPGIRTRLRLGRPSCSDVGDKRLVACDYSVEGGILSFTVVARKNGELATEVTTSCKTRPSALAADTALCLAAYRAVVAMAASDLDQEKISVIVGTLMRGITIGDTRIVAAGVRYSIQNIFGMLRYHVTAVDDYGDPR